MEGGRPPRLMARSKDPTHSRIFLFSAPGSAIYSADVASNGAQDNYDSWSGTSMACPNVAGLVSIALAQDPSTVNPNLQSSLDTVRKLMCNARADIPQLEDIFTVQSTCNTATCVNEEEGLGAWVCFEEGYDANRVVDGEACPICTFDARGLFYGSKCSLVGDTPAPTPTPVRTPQQICDAASGVSTFVSGERASLEEDERQLTNTTHYSCRRLL